MSPESKASQRAAWQRLWEVLLTPPAHDSNDMETATRRSDSAREVGESEGRADVAA